MIKPQEQIGSVTRKGILVLTFAFSAVLALIAVLPSTWVRAQSEHLPCIPPSNAPSQVFELVPRIPQLAPSDVAVGIFVTHTFSIDLEGGEIVCLASSPDGRGALRVDDQIDLQVTHADGSKASWTYNFYDPITTGITSGPPQDVSRLFSPGRNDVLIFLTDVTPKYHSAEPIWLVIWQGLSRVTDVPVVIGTLMSTNTPAPISTSENTNTATPISPLVIATAAVSPIRTPSATPLPPGPPEDTGIQEIIWGILLVIAVALGVVLWLWLRPYLVMLGHSVARLFLQMTRGWRIRKIRSAPDPNVAFREFDKAFGEITNARTRLSETTVSSVSKYFEALYDSVIKDE